MRYRELAVVLALLAGTGTAWAQTTDVEVEPIACWWRASSGSIRVGQPFSVLLTCAVVETQSTRVVADRSRLDPSAMQLPPFEVMGGTHGTDVRTASRRFFQYEYRLRLVAENLFGADATLPPLDVAYHVETRAERGDATQGRELIYKLPALTLRAASLVPDATKDIREAPGPRLTDIDGLRLRANMFRVAGAALLAIGLLVAAGALVGALRRRRTTADEPSPTLPPRRVLGAVAGTLRQAAADGQRTGWTTETVGQALAAARIAAAYAVGRPVGQQAAGSAPPLDGQLAIAAGWRRRPRIVSGAATAEDVARALQASPTDRRLTLEELRDALTGLTRARYGRLDDPAAAGLDDAAAAALRAAGRLATDHSWIADARRRAAAWFASRTGRVWTR